MKTREDILKGLEDQYNSEYANKGYPPKFKADAFFTQCNFGGLSIIMGQTGDSALIWSDWGDTALDESLILCKIEYIDGYGDGDLVPAVNYKGTYYNLHEFMLCSI